MWISLCVIRSRFEARCDYSGANRALRFCQGETYEWFVAEGR
jgi:hypothetical protein